MEEVFKILISEEQIRKKHSEVKSKLPNLKEGDLLTIISMLGETVDKDDNCGYFKSEKHKFAFMLIRNEQAVFDEDLGIKKKHYIDKEAAKEWKMKYIKMFHPDKNLDDNGIDFDAVTQKINKIYNRMVGKA